MICGQHSCLVTQHQRQHDERTHQHRVQYKDARIKAQQLPVRKNAAKLGRDRLGLAMNMQLDRPRHNEHDDKYAADRQHGGQGENPGYPDNVIQHRTEYQCQRKRQADTHADQRHGLGAMLFARQVRCQRHDGRSNGAGTLQGAPGDNQPDGIGQRRHHATECKHQQTADNHGLAADPVRQQSGRDLQQCLRDAIDTDRQPGQRRGHAVEIGGIQGKNRQYHEQPQHAQGINT